MVQINRYHNQKRFEKCHAIAMKCIKKLRERGYRSDDDSDISEEAGHDFLDDLDEIYNGTQVPIWGDRKDDITQYKQSLNLYDKERLEN